MLRYQRTGALILFGFLTAIMTPIPSAMANPPSAHRDCIANLCREECHKKFEAANAKCRKIPKDQKARRERCWRKANEAHADCLAKCPDSSGKCP